MQIDAQDQLCRLAIYPRFLRNSAFDPEALFAMSRIAGTDKFVFSVGNLSMLPTKEEAHGFGCRSAAVAREGVRIRFALEGREPVRFEETPHYRGFYSFQVSAATGASTNLHYVCVEPAEENGLPEHCHVALHQMQGTTADRKKWSQDRLAVVDEILKSMSGPFEGFCEEDADIVDRLKEIRLPSVDEF